jgi:hypothetical protein
MDSAIEKEIEPWYLNPKPKDCVTIKSHIAFGTRMMCIKAKFNTNFIPSFKT